MRSLVCYCALLAGTINASVANADPTSADRTLAQGLFQQGKKLMEAKDYPAACAKFAESERLDPSAGTMLNLAVCHERAGRLATAWAEYGEAATLARHAGEDARATFADGHATALETRLAHITINVPSGSSLTVKLDGATIGSAAWGTQLPVDAGPHHVIALRGWHKAWETSKEVTDGESATVSVPASAARASGADEKDTGGVQGAPSPVPAYVAFGVGGAGLLTGTIFGAMALGKGSTLKSECSSASACPSTAQGDISALHANEWVADVGLAVAVVGAGVGTWLLLTASGDGASEKPETSARVEPVLGIGSVGLRGMFR